jgi:VanZ family protein
MGLIFGFSTQVGSTRHTSRIIGPLLRWINPNITNASINQVQYAVRKGAHMAEYAILAALLWRARRQPVRGETRPWRWSEASFAIALSIAFAASDEFHQSFVPSREGRVTDVFIDSAGATLGIGALWLWGRRSRKW